MHRIVALVVLGFLLLQNVAAAQTATESAAETSLQPGDLIRIQVWRETDLGGDFLVNPDGSVTLPLLGTLQVLGVPLDDLRDQLIERYSVHLRNPSINITPLRRINVIGEVQRPGQYTVDPTVSLAGAVALAGGANSNGDLSRIRILRDGQIFRERVGAGETLTDADIRSGDQIVVDRRSWFERNSTFVISTLISVTSIVITIISLANSG